MKSVRTPYLFALILFCALAVNSAAEDWPTFKHDTYRTGVSGEKTGVPLHLQWVYVMRHPPAPAWGKGGRFSMKLQTGQTELPALSQFDWAAQLVVAGGRVYFGSSSDDKVYCLDAATGRESWTFYAEGPVRLAPMSTGTSLFFGSDDGNVYCVDPVNGNLVWKYNPRPDAARICGNERVISAVPIRTDVLAINGIAYFGAGLFPVNAGEYIVAVNAADGLLRTKTEYWYSYQGYQYRKLGSDSILCATGSGDDQYFTRLLAKQMASTESTFDTIKVDTLVFRGTSGLVSSSRGGWSAPVKGKPRSLAFSDGRLFASTDSGYIYCFAQATVVPDTVKPAAPKSFPFSGSAQEGVYRNAAAAIASISGHNRGYALVLQSNGGRLAYALACTTALNIVCVESDSLTAVQARKDLDSAGLYGRVSVIYQKGSKLPFTDFLFNVVAYDDYANGLSYNGLRTEALRVLQPYGGVAFLGPVDVSRRGPIQGAGEWSHHLCRPDNNPNSMDPYVNSDLKLQWFGKPGPERIPDREAKALAALWKNGVLAIPGEEYLTVVDGYNGAVLWEKSISQFLRLPGIRHCGYAALDSDYIYVASGKQCLAMDQKTGDDRLAFSIPTALSNASVSWGLVAVSGNQLFGTTIRTRGIERIASQKTQFSMRDNQPHAVEDALFAYGRRQNGGQPVWTYRPDSGRIVSTTITIAQNTVYFLESTKGAIKNTDTCLFTLASLFGNKTAALVALNALSGATLWRDTLDLSALTNSVTMIYAQGRLVLVGNYNASSHPQFDFVSFNATTGQQQWKTVQSTTWGAGGNHGEQDHRAFVINNTLRSYNQMSYNLSTGAALGNANIDYGRCTNSSASLNTIFPVSLFGSWQVHRSGCVINNIPAGGMLSIPEASSGCICPFSVQTSVGLLTRDTGLITAYQAVELNEDIKEGAALFAFPNPFNPAVTIQYTLPPQTGSAFYSLRIFDCQGRFVVQLASGRAGNHDLGPRRAVWSGTSREGKRVASGIYFYQLTCGTKSVSRPIILVK